MEGAVASILLQVPFFKHVFGWIGGHTAGDGPPLADLDSLKLKYSLWTPVSMSVVHDEESASVRFRGWLTLCVGSGRWR